MVERGRQGLLASNVCCENGCPAALPVRGDAGLFHRTGPHVEPHVEPTPFYGDGFSLPDVCSPPLFLLILSYLVSPALACGRLLELPCPLRSTLPILSLFLPYSVYYSFFRHPSLPRALPLRLSLGVLLPPLLSPFPLFSWVSHFSWAHSRALACFRGHHVEKGKNSRPRPHPCIRGGIFVSDLANVSCGKQHPCRATKCQCGSPGLR
jgi:hypothetical protein